MIGLAGGWPGRIGRILAGRPRLLAGVGCGLLAALALWHRAVPMTAAVLAWDIGVAAYLALAALLFAAGQAESMPVRAAREQEGEWTIFALAIAGAVFSLVAVLDVFAAAKGLPPAGRGLHIVLVATTLLLSWLMMHATFAFRYAHEFYAADLHPPAYDGGLEFPDESRPDYLDFMYFSLVLGMTFQVSDVQITARKLRRLATLHGLLSFLFNTVILALMVNIAAGLV